MVVPLIAIIDANTPECLPFPGVNGAGEVALGGDDGESAVFRFDKIECRDFPASGSSQITFWLDGVPSKSWKVTVTDERVIVSNKYSKGLFGKAKEKSGKISAGHMYYGSVMRLSAFKNNSDLVLIICCQRKNGTKTAFTIASSDADTMKKLAVTLHDRIDNWIIKKGRRLNGSDQNDNVVKAVEKWDAFNAGVWADNREYNVIIPSSEWETVPDSRVAETIEQMKKNMR